MKIIFHGGNAANFKPGFAELLQGRHEILEVSEKLDQPGEAAHFMSADVIISNRLSAAEPVPAKVRLYHAPAAGVSLAAGAGSAGVSVTTVSLTSSSEPAGSERETMMWDMRRRIPNAVPRARG